MKFPLFDSPEQRSRRDIGATSGVSPSGCPAVTKMLKFLFRMLSFLYFSINFHETWYE